MNAQFEGLEVDAVTVRLGGVDVVRAASLRLAPGQIAAVLGPSGCGKSTLLRAIAGLERPRSGSVLFAGAAVDDVAVHRRGFALMFQEGQLFGHRNVESNVGYALNGQSRAARSARVQELLDLVQLDGMGRRFPAELSGGEQQRVALARALAASPRLLLLDEPLSALDRDLRERLAGDLRTILTRVGATAIVVTHDHDEAFALADQLILMREGQILQSGTPAQVWHEPVDAEAARFMGYAHVVGPAAAARLGVETTSPVALRRSALVLDNSGPLHARVTSWRGTPEHLRLKIQIAGIEQELDAVADRDAAAHWALGQQVKVRLDSTRTARLPGH